MASGSSLDHRYQHAVAQPLKLCSSRNVWYIICGNKSLKIIFHLEINIHQWGYFSIQFIYIFKLTVPMLSFLGNKITIPWTISDDNSRNITQINNIYVCVMWVLDNLTNHRI